MSRILVDVEEKILAKAVEHFKKHGYEKTDMKSIAADLDISVGTVYNNFKSKPELFVAACRVWRDEMTEPVQAIMNTDERPAEKLVRILESLSANAEGFFGLWKEFLVTGELKSFTRGGQDFFKAHEQEEIEFHGRLQELVLEATAGLARGQALFQAPDFRFTQNLVSTTIVLAMKYPGQTEKNNEYLRLLVSHLLNKEIV